MTAIDSLAGPSMVTTFAVDGLGRPVVEGQGGVMHIRISCGEICNHAVKVLTKNFYSNIASIILMC